jgi:hypothetical protein
VKSGQDDREIVEIDWHPACRNRAGRLEALPVQSSKTITRFRVPLQTSASLAGAFLTPAAAIAAALSVWRLSADPGWTSGFFIREGLLSRYQFWFAAAISAQTAAIFLKRWSRTPQETSRAPVRADL